MSSSASRSTTEDSAEEGDDAVSEETDEPLDEPDKSSAEPGEEPLGELRDCFLEPQDAEHHVGQEKQGQKSQKQLDDGLLNERVHEAPPCLLLTLKYSTDFTFCQVYTKFRVNKIGKFI